MPTVTIIQPTIQKEITKLRVAAYCRVSSSSDDQLNSYMAQMTYYSHKFENSETEILVDLYADEGITGTCQEKRNEFLRMMQDCRRGKIDRIYTKSVSRFARNTKDCLQNVRELKSLGITIFFEKENLDTAKITDEMMITIMGCLAQEESVSISKNQRWSIQKRMEMGTFVLTHTPYGYRMENQKLVICEEEAEIVRYIFYAYLSGNGICGMIKILNHHPEYLLNRDHWTYEAIRYILTNEKYTGNSLWHKKCTTQVFPFKKIRNKGIEPMYYAENTHPAIIPMEIFEQVQHLMRSRFCEKKPVSSVFSKKISCGECGSLFRVKHAKNRRFWVCRKHDKGAECCSILPIDDLKIQSAFIRMFNKLMMNYKEILLPLQRDLQELKARKFRRNTYVMDIHKEMAKIKEQVHVLASLRTKGFVSEEKYHEQTAKLNGKISRLQREMKQLIKSDDEDETLEQIELLTDFFENRKQAMITLEEETFIFLIDRIIAKNQTLEFYLLGGLKLTETIS
ncbi:MAG: recombinase family protein [Oscillospiraceae bacterium]|nr:recombinase family protein [Oscillospiraceae bacterium]